MASKSVVCGSAASVGPDAGGGAFFRQAGQSGRGTTGCACLVPFTWSSTSTVPGNSGGSAEVVSASVSRARPVRPPWPPTPAAADGAAGRGGRPAPLRAPSPARSRRRRPGRASASTGSRAPPRAAPAGRGRRTPLQRHEQRGRPGVQAGPVHPRPDGRPARIDRADHQVAAGHQVGQLVARHTAGFDHVDRADAGRAQQRHQPAGVPRSPSTSNRTASSRPPAPVPGGRVRAQQAQPVRPSRSDARSACRPRSAGRARRDTSAAGRSSSPAQQRRPDRPRSPAPAAAGPGRRVRLRRPAGACRPGWPESGRRRRRRPPARRRSPAAGPGCRFPPAISRPAR